MGAFGSFLVELKRRHVYRVAVAYAAIGWLLVQVVTQVFPLFSYSLWMQRLAVLIVLGGFPVALLVAWFYELGPAGLRRDAREGAGRARPLSPHGCRDPGTGGALDRGDGDPLA